MAKTILVIDDEAGVRDAFELALLPQGYTVELAVDGLSGVSAAARRRPDLIFLDLKMPGIDGVETLRRLAALYETPIPVYIVTAFASEYLARLKQAREEQLAFQLAAKPLNALQIREIARMVLGDR
ncbi:MAG: response regulator [Methylomonas sp.]|nr:response regulator [Methylomonas sp.]